MTKLRWPSRRHASEARNTPGLSALERAADRILRMAEQPPQSRIVKPNGKPTYRAAKHRTESPDGIYITVGPDCPWNTTPGIRQVHHFNTRDEARAAGFD